MLSDAMVLLNTLSNSSSASSHHPEVDDFPVAACRMSLSGLFLIQRSHFSECVCHVMFICNVKHSFTLI